MIAFDALANGTSDPAIGPTADLTITSLAPSTPFFSSIFLIACKEPTMSDFQSISNIFLSLSPSDKIVLRSYFPFRTLNSNNVFESFSSLVIINLWPALVTPLKPEIETGVEA